MERVRLGLIGMGMIGKLHAETMSRMPELEFVAASDIDMKYQRIAKEMGAKFYQSYEEMIEKERLDGVVIAVPNELHLPVGAKCAERKLHLLLEKPIASSLSDADAIIEAAKKNGVHLLIGHHRRHNPLIEALRETIRGGGIGKLVEGCWGQACLLRIALWFKFPFKASFSARPASRGLLRQGPVKFRGNVPKPIWFFVPWSPESGLFLAFSLRVQPLIQSHVKQKVSGLKI